MPSPNWILREIDEIFSRNVILDTNSGLVCCDIKISDPESIPEKSRLRAIGLWFNDLWNYKKLKQTSKIAEQFGIEMDADISDIIETNEEYYYEHIERRTPATITWNPDFTIICPDRDVLISRKCFMESSKFFKLILEDDNECKSLSLSWNSKGVICVMDLIHIKRCIELCRVSVPSGKHGRDAWEFSFQYEIEPIFSTLRTAFINMVSKNDKVSFWLPFLHKFKNPDGTPIFIKEINEIRKAIVDLDRIDKYIELSLTRKDEDLRNDDLEIIRMMRDKLKKTSK